MPVTDIASKIIERTEALTENKLIVAAELTKIIYSTQKEKLNEDIVLRTYFNCYERIQQLAPPPLEGIGRKKINRFMWAGSIISFLVFILYWMLFFYK